MNSHDGTGVHV